MGVHIAVNSVPSQTASVASEEDEDFQDEVHDSSSQISPSAASPPYIAAQPHSTSGSSTHPSHYIVQYPSEIPHEGEGRPSDPAPRVDHRSRPHTARAGSLRREAPQQRHHHTQPSGRPRHRTRRPPSEISSESDDSAEVFIHKQEYDIGSGMPRPTSYYGPNGYTHSNSSTGSYGYPQVPASNQIVAYPPQQAMHPQYGHPPHNHGHYPPVTSPPPMGYPQPPPAQHPQSALTYNAPVHHGMPQYGSPYGPPAVHQQYMPPGAPAGYFPPGYPAPHQYPTQYYQPPPHLYAQQQIPPLPDHMSAWRTRSPHPNASVSSSSSEKHAAVEQEEIIKRFEALILAKDEERKAAENARQEKIRTAEDQIAAIRKADQERQLEEIRIKSEAMRAAQEQAEAAAKAQAQRSAEEARIRREATEAAERAIAAAAAAAAEQTAREARIRKEAAEAALEKAAADAKAKADQEAREAKIAKDAAEAAKSSAEKAAAAAAAKVQEAAKKEKDEADKKLKEAEEASKKAKTEADAAQAAAKAAAGPEKKAPIRFKDAIGRNYNFPWERCHKWRDMEGLIIQAFQHIQELGPHVIEGRYDLIGPDKEIIMPEYWDVTVAPDMHVTMMLWPIPEKPPEPHGGPPLGEVIDLDELLNGPKKKGKGKNRGGGGIGSAFGNWMLGGAVTRPRKPPGKDHKKHEGGRNDLFGYVG